jgi:hypothetical protein
MLVEIKIFGQESQSDPKKKEQLLGKASSKLLNCAR